MEKWEDATAEAAFAVLKKCRKALDLGMGDCLSDKVVELAEWKKNHGHDHIDAALYRHLCGEVKRMKDEVAIHPHVTIRGIGDIITGLRRTIRRQSEEIAALKAQAKANNVICEQAMIDCNDYKPEHLDQYRCELEGCRSGGDTPAKWVHTGEEEEDLPIDASDGYRGRWICDDCYRRAFELANG